MLTHDEEGVVRIATLDTPVLFHVAGATDGAGQDSLHARAVPDYHVEDARMVPSVLRCAAEIDAVQPTVRIRREPNAHELVREPAVGLHLTHQVRRVVELE